MLRCARWLQLPEMGVWPQLAVLQSFQQIVELQESSRLLVDLGLGGRPDHPYGELKVRIPCNVPRSDLSSCVITNRLRIIYITQTLCIIT